MSSSTPRLLSILVCFAIELMPVSKAEAQSDDPSLWQQVTANPETYVVAPALLNQLLPFEGEQTFSTATLGQVTSLTGINSAARSQALQSSLTSISKLRSTSTLTNVMLGVAGGVLLGTALYQGVKCYRSNRKIRRDALLAQKEYIAQQNTLMAQRQALNERVAEAAAAGAAGRTERQEVLVHAQASGADEHDPESYINEAFELPSH